MKRKRNIRKAVKRVKTLNKKEIETYRM